MTLTDFFILTRLQQVSEHRDNLANAESGSVGQQSEEAKPEAKGGSRLSNNLTTSRKSGYGLKSHHVSVSRGDAKKLRDLLAGNNPSQLRLHRNNDGYPSTPSGGEIKSRAEGSG